VKQLANYKDKTYLSMGDGGMTREYWPALEKALK